MPELPEVETIVRELDRGLRSHSFGRVTLLRKDIVHGDPRPLSTLLTGRKVRCVRRRAKRIIFELKPSTELVFHLGMTGRLLLSSRNALIAPHTHLRIQVRGPGRELRFVDPRRFGGIWCLTGSAKHVGKRLGPLGPEPLETTSRQFGRMLERSRQIKALLLDQAVIAGLGNIYCDESLHGARIHPMVRADSLDAEKRRRLLQVIKRTLRRAIRHRGSTLSDYRQPDGTAGSFQNYHRVYGRSGEPCKQCGTGIERIIAAGRSTFLCPTCQSEKKGSGYFIEK